MRLVTGALFAAFLICAALTVFFQIRLGSLTGTARDSEPSAAARTCRRRAVSCAAGAGICLVLAMAAGATLR